MNVRHTAPTPDARVAAVSGAVRLPDMRLLAYELDVRLTPDVERVVIDLRRVEEMAEIALVAALRGVRNAMRRRSGLLALVAGGRRRDRLADLTRFDDVFVVADSVDEALGDAERRQVNAGG